MRTNDEEGEYQTVEMSPLTVLHDVAKRISEKRRFTLRGITRIDIGLQLMRIRICIFRCRLTRAIASFSLFDQINIRIYDIIIEIQDPSDHDDFSENILPGTELRLQETM